MDNKQKTKQLLKILFGAAWIDGTIQAQERDYLRQMATRLGLIDDPEIRSLLTEIKRVQPGDCYRWLEEYLGNRPQAEDYGKLIEALSALIYSDGDVQTPEAQLLTKIQLLDPANDASHSKFDKLLKSIQKIYRKAISQTNS